MPEKLEFILLLNQKKLQMKLLIPGDEDVEFDNVNLEETNLTSTELAAETDEDKKIKQKKIMTQNHRLE